MRIYGMLLAEPPKSYEQRHIRSPLDLWEPTENNTSWILSTVASFGGAPVSVWRVINKMAKEARCSSRCEREQLKRCALRHIWKLTKRGLLRRVNRGFVALQQVQPKHTHGVVFVG
jgi:hypothetical protein